MLERSDQHDVVVSQHVTQDLWRKGTRKVRLTRCCSQSARYTNGEGELERSDQHDAAVNQHVTQMEKGN